MSSVILTQRQLFFTILMCLIPVIFLCIRLTKLGPYTVLYSIFFTYILIKIFLISLNIMLFPILLGLMWSLEMRPAISIQWGLPSSMWPLPAAKWKGVTSESPVPVDQSPLLLWPLATHPLESTWVTITMTMVIQTQRNLPLYSISCIRGLNHSTESLGLSI